MRDKQIKAGIWTVLIIIAIALIARFVFAATFNWSPDPQGYYNVSEDSNFLYDINVTVTESLVIYSDDSASTFPTFDMNSTTGLINFTPDNDDVGTYNITIIAANLSYPLDKIIATMIITVLNTNDPPVILSYTPTNLTPTIYENETSIFTYANSSADVDLIHAGADELTQNWTLNDTTQTTNLTWYYIPGYCEGGVVNITLNVTDLYNESDQVSWLVTIANTNRLPVNNDTLPNVTMQEDAASTTVFDLDSYFYDPDSNECNGSQNDTLTYHYFNNSNVTVYIDPTTHEVNITPDPDFWGVEYVYFGLNDTYNITLSIPITITINDTNDAPNVTAIGNKTTYEGAYFSYQVIATDPDGDPLQYFDNMTIFDINNNTGLISFTPNTSQAGDYVVNITVSDGILNTTVQMNLTIIDNNLPELNFIGDQNATENIAFEVNISANESDGQNITWWTDSTIFNITSINATWAQISFTPANSDVGSYSINITAYDEFNASDSEVINFTVIDVLNPPVLAAIGDQTARINISYTLVITATDLDDDSLTFYNNVSPTLFNLSVINTTAVMINFTPIDADWGNYSIEFNVTDGSLWDNESITFEVRPNFPPHIDPITNYSIPENIPWAINVTGFDNDQDTLTFTTNYTGLTVTQVNGSVSSLSMTPDQADVGIHIINVTASDGYGGYNSTLLNLTVTGFNDTPYFDPALEDMTAFADTQFLIYFNISEEENDTVNVSDNSTFFNITLVSNYIAMINFTPIAAQVGNYTIQINVTDFNSTNSTIINFEIRPYNYAPNITSYSPAANASAYENESLQFTHTSSDPNGDPLNYAWYLEGSLVASTMNYTYNIGFFDAGYRNITLIVDDGFLNDTQYWNITVNNTNRPISFGTVGLYNYSDFYSPNMTNINLTLNGTIILSYNGSDYSNGTYITPPMDLHDTNYLNISNVSYSISNPTGTQIQVFSRTSSSNSTGWSSWESVTNNSEGLVTSPPNRYVQFMINMTTNDSNATPSLTDLVVYYVIGDMTIPSNSDVFWVDLDDFFIDLDTDYNTTYNTSGPSVVVITINNLTNQARLQPQSTGEEDFYFYAFDGYNTTSSNLIHIIVTDSGNEQQQVPSSGGGGGGSSGTQTQEIIIKETEIVNKTENVTVPLAFELLVPGIVTVYQNETFTVPITLTNLESNLTLRGIYLSAESENPEIEIRFQQYFFDELKPNETTSTELYVTSFKVFGSYEVLIKANVVDPVYNDTAKFFINSLEKGGENSSLLNTKLSFTQDLLGNNPECMELAELLVEAKTAIHQQDYELAEELLNTVIEGCKYLLNLNESLVPEVEKPWADKGYNWITSMWKKISSNTLALSAVIISLFLLTMGGVLYYVQRKQVSKSEQEVVDRTSGLADESKTPPKNEKPPETEKPDDNYKSET